MRCSVCGGVDIAGIDSVEVTTLPEKLDYLEGSLLDVTGGKVTVRYSDETSEEIDLTADMVKGYDALSPGVQTLTVDYHGITTTFTVTVQAKSLAFVAVDTPPAKLTYIRGEEELDLTGGLLTLIYNNGAREEIPLTTEMVSTIDHSQAGTQSIAVFYENLFDFFDVMLIDRTGIAITTLPDRLSALEGMPIDLSGSQLTVSFSDGSTAIMSLEQSMLSYDQTAIGIVEVTVSYKGFTDTFTVEITAKSAVSIEVVPPSKLIYLEGKDEFDPADGKVIVFYDNGTEEEIAMTETMVSGFDNTTIGTQTLTVSYGDFSDTFEVEIEGRSLASIGVVTPETLVFIEGTELDVRGGKVILYYNNDTEEEIELTKAMVSGFDNTTIGTQTLTVSYGGFTANYTAEIIAKTAESIAVTTLPDSLSYVEGKMPLDVRGGKITVYYDNGTEETMDLTAEMVSGFDHTVVGTQTLTVRYGGLETTYDITIEERVVRRMTLQAPAQLTYLQGSPLNVTGGYLTVVYESESDYTEKVVLTERMISGYDPEKVGVQTVTVSYEGEQKAFAVRVTAKSAISIEVVPPTKLTYSEGTDDFDPSGGKVIISYNNGTEEEIDLTAEMVDGFDHTVVGTQTLTVTYGGFSDTFDVEIVIRSHANKTTVAGKAATCTEPGLTEGVYCPDCDTWLTEQEEIPASNHANKTAVAGKAATCTEPGLTEGVYCPDCNTWLTEQEEIPAVDHDVTYQIIAGELYGVCGNCGDKTIARNMAWSDMGISIKLDTAMPSVCIWGAIYDAQGCMLEVCTAAPTDGEMILPFEHLQSAVEARVFFLDADWIPLLQVSRVQKN